MMFGLPAMALAIWLNTPKAYRKKAGALLAGVAFTSFLTGITEPLEFLFMFVAPPLYLLHAILTGLALAAAQALDIHAGFGFSAGFIDYVINYKLSTNGWMLLPLGLLFGILYFFGSYLLIRMLKLKILESELEKEGQENGNDDETEAFIKALGGKENILETDACITRLRMKVKDSTKLNDKDFVHLGAKGVVRPDKTTIQIILGAKAEGVAEHIRSTLNKTLLSED